MLSYLRGIRLVLWIRLVATAQAGEGATDAAYYTLLVRAIKCQM